MKVIALLFSGLVMSLSTLSADVVVYRGTVRVTGDLSTTSNFPRLLGIYVVVDFETRQYSNIGFWTKGRVKRSLVGSPTDINMMEAAIPAGRTATVMASGSSNSTDATTFDHTLLYLRGKNADLLIQKAPTTARIPRPRSLKGYSIGVISSAAARTFAELTLALSYDQRTTLAANNAGRTLAEATEDIEAKLLKKGYDPL